MERQRGLRHEEHPLNAGRILNDWSVMRKIGVECVIR